MTRNQATALVEIMEACDKQMKKLEATGLNRGNRLYLNVVFALEDAATNIERLIKTNPVKTEEDKP